MRRIRRLWIAALLALLSTVAFSTPQPAAATPSRLPVAPIAVRACVGGQWTQVHWYVNPFWPLNYRYRVNEGVYVKWRWYSGGVPPYWEGSFTTQGDIWAPPSWYTSVEFLCSTTSNVEITPI